VGQVQVHLVMRQQPNEAVPVHGEAPLGYGGDAVVLTLILHWIHGGGLTRACCLLTEAGFGSHAGLAGRTLTQRVVTVSLKQASARAIRLVQKRVRVAPLLKVEGGKGGVATRLQTDSRLAPT
jgi:hypothetical protein